MPCGGHLYRLYFTYIKLLHIKDYTILSHIVLHHNATGKCYWYCVGVNESQIPPYQAEGTSLKCYLDLICMIKCTTVRDLQADVSWGGQVMDIWTPKFTTNQWAAVTPTSHHHVDDLKMSLTTWSATESPVRTSVTLVLQQVRLLLLRQHVRWWVTSNFMLFNHFWCSRQTWAVSWSRFLRGSLLYPLRCPGSLVGTICTPEGWGSTHGVALIVGTSHTDLLLCWRTGLGYNMGPSDVPPCCCPGSWPIHGSMVVQWSAAASQQEASWFLDLESPSSSLGYLGFHLVIWFPPPSEHEHWINSLVSAPEQGTA